MFLNDDPILSKDQDLLNREVFVRNLTKSILDLKEKSNLVIGLYGNWGSGKSSILNLIIEEINDTTKPQKPIILEFNPWIFSGQKNLNFYFFKEISRELKIKNTDVSRRLAKKFAFLASIFDLVSLPKVNNKLFITEFVGVVIIIISYFNLFNISTELVNTIIFWIGIIFAVFAFLSYYSKLLSEYHLKKYILEKKSISETKREIKNILEENSQRLLIIIDDIDRLPPDEIREILKLVRLNADFPNTTYILSFDREIISKTLDEYSDTNGREYIKKIVQVDFDVPFSKKETISTVLFQELDKIINEDLAGLSDNYFGDNNIYWISMYNSGYKDFFQNIRDVKRYISSLRLNIKNMINNNTLEVNPIDFFAIESLRVFSPNTFDLIRNNLALFTSLERSSNENNEKRKDEIKKIINKANSQASSVEALIKFLFPQIKDLLESPNITYGSDFHKEWSKTLRICSENNFDSYFTLIPGGSPNNIGEYEIATILSSTKSKEDFDQLIVEYFKRDRLDKLLSRLKDYITNENDINDSDRFNIIQSLFNISDELRNKYNLPLSLSIMDLSYIIFQLTKRNTDTQNNYQLLKKAINETKSLSAPIDLIHSLSNRNDNNIIPIDKLEELRNLAVNKIEELSPSIINNTDALFILHRWKLWNKKTFDLFIQNQLKCDSDLISLMKCFKKTTYTTTKGKTIEVDKKSLVDLLSFDEHLVKRLESVKDSNKDLYNNNRCWIDLILKEFQSENN